MADTHPQPKCETPRHTAAPHTLNARLTGHACTKLGEIIQKLIWLKTAKLKV